MRNRRLVEVSRMSEEVSKAVWLVVRPRGSLLGNRYRYWGRYASDVEALREANTRNYRGSGYLEVNEKYFAYRVMLTRAEIELLAKLSEGEQEYSVLRFARDSHD
jgi:hypothetical protein